MKEGALSLEYYVFREEVSNRNGVETAFYVAAVSSPEAHSGFGYALLICTSDGRSDSIQTVAEKVATDISRRERDAGVGGHLNAQISFQPPYDSRVDDVSIVRTTHLPGDERLRFLRSLQEMYDNFKNR